MFREFIDGITYYFKALNFIFTHNLISYFLLSGIISVLIGSSIFSSAYIFADDLGGMLSGLYPLEWGKMYMEKIANVLAGGIMIVLGLYFFKYIILIAISPLMGPLSAKVENIVTGNKLNDNFSISQTGKEIIRGITLSGRNALRELLIICVLLLLSFFPIINTIVPVLIFLVQAYYVGFGHYDYFLERRATIAQSVIYVKHNRWFTTGNGTAFLLLLMIPIIGLFVAPVLGTVAASLRASEG